MGTWYHIRAWSSHPVKFKGKRISLEQALSHAVSALSHIDALMSTYKPDSELSRFNSRKTTEPVPISDDLCAVLQIALEASRESDGAFDVTVGPLVNAWGFGPPGRPIKEPSKQMLSHIREFVGYQKLILDVHKKTLQKTDPRVYCDLSAVAKGYGVDKAAEALEQLGIQNYLVEVGGEVRTLGVNESGKPWRIGIEKPDVLGQVAQEIVPMSGLSMATSGDYRNYYEENGIRISHTIDPKTGQPVHHHLASVSVIDHSCARADAYATTLMVLGPDKGMQLAEKLSLPVLFLVRVKKGVFECRYSSDFCHYMQQTVPGWQPGSSSAYQSAKK